MAQAGYILGKEVPKMEAILEKQRSQDGCPQEKGRSLPKLETILKGVRSTDGPEYRFGMMVVP